MDWWAAVDIYCERTGPAFWAEPVNALSNLAFIAAGLYGLAAARRAGADGFVRLLCFWVMAIGVGSFLFHTVAVRWAGLADVLPIWTFVVVYLWFALRRLLGFGIVAAALALPAAIAVEGGITAALPASASAATNGSVQYLPALLILGGFAILLAIRRHPAARLLGLATLVLLPSLAARTADAAVCDGLPLGTHFLWHLLNGAMFALLLAAAARHGGRPVRPTA